MISSSVRIKAKTDQSTLRRDELPQADAGLLEHPPTRLVHIIALAIHDFLDADLGDLDAARQARTRVTVQDAALADALAAGFEQRVLLGVQTQACGEGRTARGDRRVAARAAAFVAVAQVAWSAIVAGRYDARVVHEDAADTAFHAV